jgi:hypothetical protein
MQNLKELIEQLIKMQLDETKLNFRTSIPYDADKVSQIIAPHKENDKILMKQASFHKSNFKSEYPKSHKYLYQRARIVRDTIKYHIRTMNKLGPFSYRDWKGDFAFKEVREYENELNLFNQNPQEYEKSISSSKMGGKIYYSKE